MLRFFAFSWSHFRCSYSMKSSSFSAESPPLCLTLSVKLEVWRDFVLDWEISLGLVCVISMLSNVPFMIFSKDLLCGRQKRSLVCYFSFSVCTSIYLTSLSIPTLFSSFKTPSVCILLLLVLAFLSIALAYSFTVSAISSFFCLLSCKDDRNISISSFSELISRYFSSHCSESRSISSQERTMVLFNRFTSSDNSTFSILRFSSVFISSPIFNFSYGQRSTSLMILFLDLSLLRSGMVFCLSLSRYLLLSMRQVLMLLSLLLFIYFMNGETELSQSKLKKDKSIPRPTHKSPFKKEKELNSPKRLPMKSKLRGSSGDINLSEVRRSTQAKQKEGPEYLQKKEAIYNKDKRCIQPTEKIVDRINYNLQLLSARIQQLFREQIEEDGFIQQIAQNQANKNTSSSLVFKKNGSTLSLTKNSSKKKLEGRMTHDGQRSDRKYGQMLKGSKLSAEPGWK